jgi:alkylhydroperoxidase family enzyme
MRGKNMPRIQPLHPDDAPPVARAILEDLFKRRNTVPNMFRTFARRPAAMKSAFDQMNAFWDEESTADAKLKELLAVRVSLLNECRY